MIYNRIHHKSNIYAFLSLLLILFLLLWQLLEENK